MKNLIQDIASLRSVRIARIVVLVDNLFYFFYLSFRVFFLLLYLNSACSLGCLIIVSHLGFDVLS